MYVYVCACVCVNHFNFMANHKLHDMDYVAKIMSNIFCNNLSNIFLNLIISLFECTSFECDDYWNC